MHADDETVAAISTPLGEGGIGIVRLSGRDAVMIAERVFSSPRGISLRESPSHKLTYGFINDPYTKAVIDEVLVNVMRAPSTYTKEDVVEINCHGGYVTLRKTLELLLREGVRLAEPGEFTKRAFLNGRIDLTQAEAVMDIIRAKTDESKRIALQQLSGILSRKITVLTESIAALCAHVEAHIDFPEEEIGPSSLEHIFGEIQTIQGKLSALSKSFEEGRFFREGLKVAIVGRPNVGKSSLLNALLNRDRAIVTDIPGTTRDVLEEYLNLRGLPVRIMDTAGIRETHEMAEREGVLRSLRAIDDADLVIALFDGSLPLHEEDHKVLQRIGEKRSIIAINKSDLNPPKDLCEGIGMHCRKVLKISAMTGEGIEDLKDRIFEESLGGTPAEITGRGEKESHPEEGSSVMVTNVRHKVSIDLALEALQKAWDALAADTPLEIVAIEMRDALDKLGEITGTVTTEDILDRIFSQFCIGK
jgi:tRNA modification GTPase